MTTPPKSKALTQKFVIRNASGLHARPAALFVQTANQFNCKIEVQKGRERVDGKSIMGIMMLAAGVDSTITVSAAGPDAKAALEALDRLILGNFGEGPKR